MWHNVAKEVAVSNQPTPEEQRTQQAVWAAMRVRAKLRDAVTALDEFHIKYPDMEGMLHARTYASSLAGMQDAFLGGLQMLMRKLPSPTAAEPPPEPSTAKVGSMGGSYGSLHLHPTGIPAGPGVATIAGLDEHHVALIVPCQTEGCGGTVEGIASVDDRSMSVEANATCPTCHTVYVLGYNFGSENIQITPLVQGGSPQ